MRNEISCRRDNFFSFYLFWIKSYSVFCQKVAKVEHTICDCNYKVAGLLLAKLLLLFVDF